VMLAILIVLSLVFVPSGRGTVWLVIPLAFVYAAFVAGVSLVVACANVVFRDIEYILTAALVPWFFVTPILWSAATLTPSAASHHKLLDVLEWGNFVAPPIAALRQTIWLGQAPRLADVIYLVVAAFVSLSLGAFVFSRVDDRLAVEL